MYIPRIFESAMQRLWTRSWNGWSERFYESVSAGQVQVWRRMHHVCHARIQLLSLARAYATQGVSLIGFPLSSCCIFWFVDSNGQNDFDTKSHVRSHNNSSCLCRFTQFTWFQTLVDTLEESILSKSEGVALEICQSPWQAEEQMSRTQASVCKCENHMKTQSSSASVQGPWKRYQLCHGWRGANSIGNHL